MQARQMVTHGHFLFNGVKHNIPSVFVKTGDIIVVKTGLKDSPLYSSQQESTQTPSWCKVNSKSNEIEVLNFPKRDEVTMPVDLLKVIEFYARA
jgi:small subunit ribosomal protein S4